MKRKFSGRRAEFSKKSFLKKQGKNGTLKWIFNTNFSEIASLNNKLMNRLVCKIYSIKRCKLMLLLNRKLRSTRKQWSKAWLSLTQEWRTKKCFLCLNSRQPLKACLFRGCYRWVIFKNVVVSLKKLLLQSTRTKIRTLPPPKRFWKFAMPNKRPSVYF